MNPLNATAALDRYYLETRCKLIEIAANLDRIDRGADAAAARKDARWDRLRSALALLGESDATSTDRAERLQHVFSLPYEEKWSPPNGR